METSALPVYRPGRYLTLRVAQQDFAIEASRVHGILPLHELSALDVPLGWVLGSAVMQGRDFPVVDVRAKFGIARGSHGRQPCIVVVESGSRLVGFVADRVSEVVAARERDFHNGALRTHGRLRRVLDPDLILP